jgi:heterotetrameric sarcosine oxidase delta subunit
MIAIDCPVCGLRESSEFQWWGEIGEAGETSPVATADLRGARRAHYLQVNAPGWMLERWLHAAGCGRFIVVERHRTSNRIRDVRPERERWVRS